MFESLRKSLDDLLSRSTPPEERRQIVSRMKDTLVQARLGLEDMRDGLAQSRRRLEHQRRDRSGLAEPTEVPAHHASQASRTPEKICRRIGWSQLRKLGRRIPGATAHDPPRSTL